MNNFVTIKHYGKVNVHLPHQNGNYATLCGMDGSDKNPAVDMETIPTKPGAKVDCPDCCDIWMIAQSFSKSDFTPSNIASTGQRLHGSYQ